MSGEAFDTCRGPCAKGLWKDRRLAQPPSTTVPRSVDYRRFGLQSAFICGFLDLSSICICSKR